MHLQNELEVVASIDDSDKGSERTYGSPGVCGAWRFVMAVMGFLAMTTSYAMRSHLSVTIVAMVGTPNSTSSTQCNSSEAIIITGKQGEFHWDPQLQGIVNSAFYYGYLLPQIVGGRLAEKYNAKWVVFSGGCLATAATLVGPVAARFHVACFIITRVLCGFGLAVFQPSLHALISRWSPVQERSIFSAIIYSGNQFGVVLAMPISGVLCSSSSPNNWTWPFYIFGIVGAVWLVGWTIFVYKSPAEHPWILEDEKRFIESGLNNAKSKHGLPVPWKKIFKSKSVWGLILCHFGYNWGFYTLLTELPTYMSNVLGFSLNKNGILSSLPYMIMMVVGYMSSYAAFQVIKRQMLPVVVVRKGLNTIAFYGSAISLLAITFIHCKTMTIYGMLMLAVVFYGLTYAGFQINHVDLSPNFAGTLQGITNTAACIPGIISPYIVGVITNGNETQAAWNTVFYIAFAILVSLGTWYLIMGSANLKSWNDSDISFDKQTLEDVNISHTMAFPTITSHLEKHDQTQEKH